MRLTEHKAAASQPTGPAFSQTRAVEVGFEPTEDLRLHTLSSIAHHRPPPSASVPGSMDTRLTAAREPLRTGVNETETETGCDAAPARPGADVRRPRMEV